jgi:hypothetical protein
MHRLASSLGLFALWGVLAGACAANDTTTVGAGTGGTSSTTSTGGGPAGGSHAGGTGGAATDCGNGTCSNTESCTSCPVDCGPCPTEPVKGLIIGGNYFVPADIASLRRLIPALPAEGANTLIIILNYLFEFESHPEMAEPSGIMTKAEAQELAQLARDNGVRLIPGMNLLGHQSYEGGESNFIFSLLREHPDWDESPDIADTDYARSLCPHADGVRELLTDLADEMIDTFQADQFYVGLDEVLIINHDERCTSTAEGADGIFTEWVNFLEGHLRSRQVRMWMAGDRFIPGTWYDGYWESSGNDTWQQIDGVTNPGNIFVLDWHYGVEPGGYPSIDQLFAPKGFQVAVAPWQDLAGTQAFVQYALDPTGPKFANVAGVVQTLWGGASAFTGVLLDGVPPEGTDQTHSDEAYGVVDAFRWSMSYYQPTP